VVMVEEYADGGDLFSLLQKYGGRLSERAAVQTVLDPFLRVLHVRGPLGVPSACVGGRELPRVSASPGRPALLRSRARAAAAGRGVRPRPPPDKTNRRRPNTNRPPLPTLPAVPAHPLHRAPRHQAG
jgi:hypothetical protein